MADEQDSIHDLRIFRNSDFLQVQPTLFVFVYHMWCLTAHVVGFEMGAYVVDYVDIECYMTQVDSRSVHYNVWLNADKI